MSYSKNLEVNNHPQNLRRTSNGQAIEVQPLKKTYNILVVEDENLLRTSHVNLLLSFFKSTGDNVNIKECLDGAECIFFLYHGLSNGIRYDAIITDETMNFIRGCLLCDILNGLISGNILYPIKIFMASSYESTSENMNYIKNKVMGIFNKPLSATNIQKICKTFVSV